jgi:hypothetical protein
MSESPVWVACKIIEGMFPGEFGAVVTTADGDRLSLFVPERRIRFSKGTPSAGKEIDGQLEVQMLDQDEEFGVVALPAHALEDGVKIARVKRNLLQAK